MFLIMLISNDRSPVACSGLGILVTRILSNALVVWLDVVRAVVREFCTLRTLPRHNLRNVPGRIPHVVDIVIGRWHLIAGHVVCVTDLGTWK